jgi:hypothetical protein
MRRYIGRLIIPAAVQGKTGFLRRMCRASCVDRVPLIAAMGGAGHFILATLFTISQAQSGALTLITGDHFAHTD